MRRDGRVSRLTGGSGAAAQIALALERRRERALQEVSGPVDGLFVGGGAVADSHGALAFDAGFHHALLVVWTGPAVMSA